jgi:hypothetical protein
MTDTSSCVAQHSTAWHSRFAWHVMMRVMHYRTQHPCHELWPCTQGFGADMHHGAFSGANTPFASADQNILSASYEAAGWVGTPTYAA